MHVVQGEGVYLVLGACWVRAGACGVRAGFSCEAVLGCSLCTYHIWRVAGGMAFMGLHTGIASHVLGWMHWCLSSINRFPTGWWLHDLSITTCMIGNEVHL